jgi:hypothetical protein
VVVSVHQAGQHDLSPRIDLSLWLESTLQIRSTTDREDALPALVLRYQAASAAGRPVHEWPLAP